MNWINSAQVADSLSCWKPGGGAGERELWWNQLHTTARDPLFFRFFFPVCRCHQNRPVANSWSLRGGGPKAFVSKLNNTIIVGAWGVCILFRPAVSFNPSLDGLKYSMFKYTPREENRSGVAVARRGLIREQPQHLSSDNDGR